MYTCVHLTIIKLACSEFNTVNIQANTIVFSLTTSTPITQVTPSTGSNTTSAFTRDLYMYTQHKINN